MPTDIKQLIPVDVFDGLLSATSPSTSNPFVTTSQIASIASMNTARILGRYSAGTGPVQEITIGSGLSLSGAGVLSATGSGTFTGNRMIVSNGGGALVAHSAQVANHIAFYDALGLPTGNISFTMENVGGLGINPTIRGNGTNVPVLNIVGSDTVGGSQNAIIFRNDALSSFVELTYDFLNVGSETLQIVTNTGGVITFTQAGDIAATGGISATNYDSLVISVGTVTSGLWNGTAIGPTFGGTGQTTYAIGDILYASAIGALSKLPIGANGMSLQVSGGVPVWASPSVAVSPRGSLGFVDNASGQTLDTVSTKVNGTYALLSGGLNFDQPVNGSLRYTGAEAKNFEIKATISGRCLVSKLCEIAIYKNGVEISASRKRQTVYTSDECFTLTVQANGVVLNDAFEVRIKRITATNTTFICDFITLSAIEI